MQIGFIPHTLQELVYGPIDRLGPVICMATEKWANTGYWICSYLSVHSGIKKSMIRLNKDDTLIVSCLIKTFERRCRNLPFGGRATRGSQVHLPSKEKLRSRHQRLFEENVEKTKKVWSMNFKCERFKSYFYTRGRYQHPARLISSPSLLCFWLFSFRNVLELYGFHDNGY